MPPLLRDQRWFMAIFFKLSLGDKAKYFLDFKDKSYGMSDEDYKNLYANTYNILGRETDLNKSCIDRLLKENYGDSVLEVGCGNGYFSGLLSEKHDNITAIDINVTPETIKNHPAISFEQGKVEDLPFKDNSFDSVICTHTLEHVLDLEKSLSELRRVATKKIIIVVPCQRPYKYSFDLHLHFFPYESSLLHRFKPDVSASYTLEKLSNDWYYTETF